MLKVFSNENHNFLTRALISDTVVDVFSGGQGLLLKFPYTRTCLATSNSYL